MAQQKKTVLRTNSTYGVELKILGVVNSLPEDVAWKHFLCNDGLATLEDFNREAENVSQFRAFHVEENTVFDYTSRFYFVEIVGRSHDFIFTGEQFLIVSQIPLMTFQCTKDRGIWKSVHIGMKRAFFSLHYDEAQEIMRSMARRKSIFLRYSEYPCHYLKMSLQLRESQIVMICDKLVA